MNKFQIVKDIPNYSNGPIVFVTNTDSNKALDILASIYNLENRQRVKNAENPFLFRGLTSSIPPLQGIRVDSKSTMGFTHNPRQMILPDHYYAQPDFFDGKYLIPAYLIWWTLGFKAGMVLLMVNMAYGLI